MPGWEPAWRRYLRFWRRDPQGDVCAEVDFHLESLLAELRAEGLSEDVARRAAEARFGNVNEITGAMHALASQRETAMQRGELLRELAGDIRYAARSLRRLRGLALTAVMILGAGLGAVASTFGMVDQLFFRPPAGVLDAGDVSRIWFTFEDRWDGRVRSVPAGGVPQLAAIRDALGAPVGLYMSDTAWRFGSARGAPRARVGFANRAYFDVLGVQPSVGRFFDASEDVVDRPVGVAVVSERFAERFLADSASAVGSVVELWGQRYSVIGVASNDFAGVDLQPTDVWLPLGDFRDDPRMLSPRVAKWWLRRGARLVRGVIRLPSDASHAAAEVATRHVRLAERGQDTLIAVSFAPAIGVRGPGEDSAEVTIVTRLAIVAALVLLIACANVANLFLARALERRREISIRAALGISRARLLRMLSVESFLVGLAAAAVALVATRWSGPALRALLMPELAASGPVLHWRVALAALSLAFVASWIAGVPPALRVARLDVEHALRATSAGIAAGPARLRAMLMAGQVALSLVLLSGAAAFTASLQRVNAIDVGYDTERTVIGSVFYEDLTQRPEDTFASATFREIASRVESRPGVGPVSLAVTRPMSGNWAIVNWFTETDSLRRDSEPDMWPASLVVSGDYFAAAGLRIVAGRTFIDTPGATVGELLVNETLARRLWPGRSALGQCVRLARSTNPCSTVVGVVGGARRGAILEEPRGMLYLPLTDFEAAGWSPSAIVARVEPDARTTVAAELRRLLAERFPLGEPEVGSLAAALEPQLRRWQLGARLFGVMGAIALLVTIAGIYAATNYSVTQRLREFGIRMAVGARTGDVIASVFARLATPIGVGMLAGIAGVWATGRVISGLLYEVSATDPLIVGAAMAAMALAAMVAAVRPALRASRESPANVLRAD